MHACRSTLEDPTEQGDGPLRAAVLVILGRLALLRGHVDDATAALDEAIDWLALGDPRNARGLALAYLARAHALVGAADDGAAALDAAEAASRQRPNNPRLRFELARARAWLDATAGRTSVAVRRLLDTADQAGEDVVAECDAIYGAVRLGADPRSCVSRLAGLVAVTDSDLHSTCAEHVMALADGNAAAQLEAAQRFALLDLDLFAAEAATGAARAFRSEGRNGSAARAAALARHHRTRCPGVRSPALAFIDHPAVELLTARELSVAQLAARGLANRVIATELILSVRSVETYVLRACRKLGVNDRGALGDVLGDAR